MNVINQKEKDGMLFTLEKLQAARHSGIVQGMEFVQNSWHCDKWCETYNEFRSMQKLHEICSISPFDYYTIIKT